jgi:hypothetical protein
MVRVRELTAGEVEFSLEIEDEDAPFDFESDEPEKDEELRKELTSRLNRGDLWAWCSVKVTAKWKTWEGVDYLGCCSYDSEKDFKDCNDYWPDMRERALEDLNGRIKTVSESIEELRVAS